MLKTGKTARFLLIFLFVAVVFSTAYLVQGGDSCAADRECNIIVAERKMMRSMEYKVRGRKMASEDYYLVKMDNTIKEKVERSKYARKSRKNYEPKGNYRASFVAFNADYKGPRRHPPKNN